MKHYIQAGLNPKYPKEIITWCPETEMDSVPEWISDRVSVRNIETYDGKIILSYLKTSTGGYAFKGADGTPGAYETRYKDDLLCFGNNRIFSLRPVQLELLYKEVENG